MSPEGPGTSFLLRDDVPWLVFQLYRSSVEILAQAFWLTPFWAHAWSRMGARCVQWLHWPPLPRPRRPLPPPVEADVNPRPRSLPPVAPHYENNTPGAVPPPPPLLDEEDANPWARFRYDDDDVSPDPRDLGSWEETYLDTLEVVMLDTWIRLAASFHLEEFGEHEDTEESDNEW